MEQKKILLIATGGTIASCKTESGLAPGLSAEQLLSAIPEAKELCTIDTLQPLHLDSTNIQPSHWLLLAKLIEEKYDHYDGFVLCHGTDTLAYTAAALSYLVQHTEKPVVLTGAQRSMDEETTDAKTNLLDSLRFACAGKSGVALVFGGHVIAGTRARKMRTKSYNAFTSLNFPELASLQDGRLVRYIPWKETGSPRFYHHLDTRVFVLKLTPGMPPEFITQAGALCTGLILESYGVGGIPDLYLEALEDLIQQGKTVVMATQVPQEGSDLSVYRVGHVLKKKYDLLESRDMTLESTVTKLMWALGQSTQPQEIRRLFTETVNYDMLF